METSKVKVDIFGHTYTIKGDASSGYIEELATYVNDKMEEVSLNTSNTNPSHIAILVALNIADEYFQLKNIKKDMTHEIEKKAEILISMLDDGLIGDIFPRSEIVQEKLV